MIVFYRSNTLSLLWLSRAAVMTVRTTVKLFLFWRNIQFLVTICFLFTNILFWFLFNHRKGTMNYMPRIKEQTIENESAAMKKLLKDIRKGDIQVFFYVCVLRSHQWSCFYSSWASRRGLRWCFTCPIIYNKRIFLVPLLC